MIITKQNNKKKVVIVLLIIVVLAAAAGAWAFYNAQLQSSQPSPTGETSKPTNTVDYNPPTDEQLEGAKEQEATVKDPQQTDPTPTGAAPVLTVTRAGQYQTNISIRTFVTGASSGTCQFTFTKAGQPTVTKTFSVAQGATEATCNGDIPASDFGAAGEWDLSATATANGKTSAAVTQKVVVTL